MREPRSGASQPAGQAQAAGPTSPSDPGARSGPIEGLLQEVIRRAATIGLGGFFLTEEAIRKALSDVVPQDWVRFVVRQSQEARRELIERVAQEFGSWLQALDPRSVARAILEDLTFSIRIDVSAEPRERVAERPDPGPPRREKARKPGAPLG
jgi:hypothetical protein